MIQATSFISKMSSVMPAILGYVADVADTITGNDLLSTVFTVFICGIVMLYFWRLVSRV